MGDWHTAPADPWARTPSPDQKRPTRAYKESILGGSWVVISRVLTRVTILITLIRGLITPPSKGSCPGGLEGLVALERNFGFQRSALRFRKRLYEVTQGLLLQHSGPGRVP